MPLPTIKFKPGIDVDQSAFLNDGGWNASNLIRFRDGLPEKRGGWAHLNATQLTGTGRGMHGWADLGANPYIAVGTEQRLELFAFGQIYDITPLRATHNVAVNVSTVITSKTVTIHDVAHGATAGDWVNILVPISIGGIVIQGFYQVATVVDADNYTITAATAATATVNNGGAVPSFTTTLASPNISVTLNNHGYAVASLFTIQVATTVGGIVIAAFTTTPVTSITSANVFVIAPGAAAGSAATVSENNGNARYQYLIPSGFASATPVSGYGIGAYGAGPYGMASGATLISPLRQWFLDNWGQDLIGNYTASPIYVWVPPVTSSNVALAINGTNFPGAIDPPVQVNSSFVAMPQQIMVALGVDPAGGGTQDPNLIRWCDVADFTNWLASATNQAGSFRLPNGSKIVGGIQGPNFAMISTDVDVWVMQYLGFPLIFGFTKISFSSDWISARCAGVHNSVVYWATNDNFVRFDGGSVQVLPCPVWDQFFANLNRAQLDKVHCWVNSWFGEVEWHYPSASATECDSYVTYNVTQNIWYYGSLPRTCGIDDNVYGAPVAVDTSGFLQQHEVSPDADGQPMLESIQSGYFALEDGSFMAFLERALPDFLMTGANAQVQYEILVVNYATDTPLVYGPYTHMETGPEYDVIRARGRFAAIRIQGTGLGTWWRLGGFRLSIAHAGKRP